MEIVGIALAVVGLLVAAGVGYWAKTQIDKVGGEKAAVETELAAVRKESEAASEKALAEAERAGELEKALAEAIARRDEKEMAAALWNLEIERSYRQWRDIIVPSAAERAADEVSVGQQLGFAISQDVERLREEVGVAIRFDGGLDIALDPEAALGALRISGELLALAAKEADEIAVSVDQGDEPSVVIVLDCQGWSPDPNMNQRTLIRDLETMANQLGGSLGWDLSDDGRIKTTLRLPV